MPTEEDDHVARLVAQAEELHRRHGTAGLERFCAQHPEHAEILLANVRGRQYLRGVRNDLTSGRAPAIGEALADRFEVRGELGRGGMGRVLRAFDRKLGREVALKIVAAAGVASEAARERIAKEARALAKLRHPGIVRVHDAGMTDDGLPFLVMDLIEGESLAERLRRIRAGQDPPLAVAAVVRLMIQVAEAIDAAHQNDVIHRDIKPSNILLDRADAPCVIDFGIAREHDASITRTGSPAGTLPYVAPELLRTDERAHVDRAVDVYSLGVTLYEALTLRCPFESDSSARLLQQILSDEPPRPRALRPELSRDLETICLRAIEKRPQDRYVSAAEFAADLRDLLALRPIRARPAGPITRTLKFCRRRPWQTTAAAAAAVAVVAIAAVSSFLVGQQRRREFDRNVADGYQEAGRDDARIDLDSFRRSIDRARSIDPASSDVRELEAAYDQRRRLQKVGPIMNHVEEVLGRMERWLGNGEPPSFDFAAAFAEVERGVEQFTLLDPGNHNITGFATRLHRSGAAWYRGHSCAELARAGIRSGVRITGNPAGAELHLFRERDLAELEPGAAHRLVPAPLDPATASVVRPGTPCLEVVDVETGTPAEKVGLIVGDLVVANERLPEIRAALRRPGATKLAILHDGELRDVTVEGGERFGATVAPTSAPLLIDVRSRIGALPTTLPTLPPGDYLLAARAPGFETQRISFRVPAEAAVALTVELLPVGTTPRGFVYIPPGCYSAGSDDAIPDPGNGERPVRPGIPIPAFEYGERYLDGYWIGRAEVTVREYRQFLDDLMRRPDERAQIEATERTRLYWRIPRKINIDRAERPICEIAAGWERLADEYRTTWDPELAIHSISCLDADAYCAWLTKRARERGENWIFRLPTEDEWEKAGRGGDDRRFPWGSTFDARFCKCLLARRPDETPASLVLEPVMSVQIDESPYGVHDMAGGCLEWCVGGSIRTDVSHFRPWRGGTVSSPTDRDGLRQLLAFRNEGFPDHPTGDDGFRVVARRIEDR